MSSGRPKRLRLQAPAKINLYLAVLGRRDNGYHDIRSVMVPVSLCDRLDLEKSESGIEVTVKNMAEPGSEEMWRLKPEDNLVSRAAYALKEATGYPGGARIRLEKTIPVGGGLGGGSSDAGVALVGLNALWETGFSVEKLMALGASLGSDVPAFVHGGPVLVEGIGEQISPVPAEGAAKKRWWLVIANPGFSLSTKDIYSRYQPSLTSSEVPYKNIRLALKEGNVELAGGNLFNALQGTVFRKYPLIEMMTESLSKAGALGALVSGSGSSVFGLARDEAHARGIGERVGKALEFPVWVRTAEILPDGVMVAHGPLEA